MHIYGLGLHILLALFFAVHAIRNGRAGQMPAHRPILGEDRVRLAAAWVLAQSQAQPNAEAH